MNLTLSDNVLWAAGFIGHVALLLVLLLRGRARKFPVFTSLIGFEALNTVTLFLVYRYGTHLIYSRVYWTSAVIDFAFQVALIYEIAQTVLSPTGSWIRNDWKRFLLWIGTSVIIAIGAAAMIVPARGSLMSTYEVRGTLFTSLLTCELFLAMVLAANRLGLQWRSHVISLGQGLTAWALVALIIDLAHIIYGWNRDFVVLDHIRMFFYLGALAFWIVMFYLPEKKRGAVSPDMERYLIALHKSVQYDLERVSQLKKPLL